MSKLQKRIDKLQRSEGGRLGFGQMVREKPRAMLLGALASDAAGAQAAVSAGVDVVVLKAGSANDASTAAKSLETEAAIGAWLNQLSVSEGVSLRDAGCDFVVCSAGGVAAAAIESDKLGLVLELADDVEDSELRILGPLGLEGLLVTFSISGPMSVADQLRLVRLAGMSGSPLLVVVDAVPPAGDLRVIRDSGGAAVILPASTSPQGFAEASAALQAIPPRRTRKDSSDLAIVPSGGSGNHEHEHEDDEDD